MKKKYLLILFILLTNIIQAQQLEQFSQRSLNVLTYNPAVAGSKLHSSLTLHHRSQWVGFEGAPMTQVLTYNGSLGRATGMGSYIFHDMTGPIRRLGVNATYAHHLVFRKFNLSLGTSLKLSQFHIDGTKLNLHEEHDAILHGELIKSGITPDATIGAFLYNRKFYFGASATQLIESKIKNGIPASIPPTTQFYVIGGYNISKNHKNLLYPSFVLTGSVATPVQAEFSLRNEYLNRYILGFTFRTKDAMVLLAGLRIHNKLFFAYSYDIVYSSLRHYNSGSHEVILSYIFEASKRANKHESGGSMYQLSNPVPKNLKRKQNKQTYHWP